MKYCLQLVPRWFWCGALLALAVCALLLRGTERGRGAPAVRATTLPAPGARAVRHVPRYGPVLPDTPLLVVLARRDATALVRLLHSLERVRDIARALLVISHAQYDAPAEQAVSRVDFCRVLQVYYPHSARPHPHGQPGPESGSRLPARLERKQHWWWTADQVFERLEWSRSYVGHAVFLDEDALAAPDLLHVLRVLRRAAGYLPRSALLALGGAGAGAADALLLRPWQPALLAAPALDRAAWTRLRPLASFYCVLDDAHWSRSLRRMLAQLPCAAVLSPAASRVHTVGEGRELHTHELFPGRMRVRLWQGWADTVSVRATGSTPAPRAGQFTDLRDQMLCLDSYMSTEPEEDHLPTINMNNRPGLIEVT